MSSRTLMSACVLFLASIFTASAQGPPLDASDSAVDACDVAQMRRIPLLERRIDTMECQIRALTRLINQLTHASTEQSATVGRGLIPLGTVLTNLNDDRMNRYFRADIVLAVTEDAEKTVIDSKAQLKDWIFIHVADKTVADLAGKENQIRLRNEIRDGLNGLLTSNEDARLITAIYFEEFSVQ